MGTDDFEMNVRSAVAAFDHARRVLENHRIMNTPTDPVARARVMEEYALAEAKFVAANLKLRRAQQELAEHLAQ